MAKDKRGARRDNHDSVVEIFDTGGKLKCTGRLADFSTTGISFSSDYAFEKGEKVKTRVRLLHRGVLDAEGEVVWVRRGNNRALYGVKFSSLKNVHPTGELKALWD